MCVFPYACMCNLLCLLCMLLFLVLDLDSWMVENDCLSFWSFTWYEFREFIKKYKFWKFTSVWSALLVPRRCVLVFDWLCYSWFHKKGTFSVHWFNDDYLSIPERPGSYKYLFHEMPGRLLSSCRCALLYSWLH